MVVFAIKGYTLVLETFKLSNFCTLELSIFQCFKTSKYINLSMFWSFKVLDRQIAQRIEALVSKFMNFHISKFPYFQIYSDMEIIQISKCSSIEIVQVPNIYDLNIQTFKRESSCFSFFL